MVKYETYMIISYQYLVCFYYKYSVNTTVRPASCILSYFCIMIATYIFKGLVSYTILSIKQLNGMTYMWWFMQHNIMCLCDKVSSVYASIYATVWFILYNHRRWWCLQSEHIIYYYIHLHIMPLALATYAVRIWHKRHTL